MGVKTEGNYLGDWLKAELFAPNYCREEVTVLEGENLVTGTVVGIITASGKYVAFDATAGDGQEDAAGILIGNVDATESDLPGVVLVRGPAVISKSGLTWHANNVNGGIASGLEDLADLGIIAREGV